MNPANCLRSERLGALVLLLVSGAGTLWLVKHAAVVTSRTCAREEQLDHLATLVDQHGVSRAAAPPSLANLDGLFHGQQLEWTGCPAGHVLSLRTLEAGGRR